MNFLVVLFFTIILAVTTMTTIAEGHPGSEFAAMLHNNTITSRDGDPNDGYPPITFGAFPLIDCQGDSVKRGDMGSIYKGTMGQNMNSFQLSRPLQLKEQLDISTAISVNGNYDNCAKFQNRFRAGIPLTCINQGAFTCFTYWVNWGLE